MGSGPNCYQVGKKHAMHQSLQILCRKKISMLTTFKRSSLAYQCVFYRPGNSTNGGPPTKLNFEGLKMQKWNIQTDKTQRVDGKMGLNV